MRPWCSAGRGNGCCSPRFWWNTAGWCRWTGSPRRCGATARPPRPAIRWPSASAGSARPSPRPGPGPKSAPPVPRATWWRAAGWTPGASTSMPGGPAARWPRATARRPPGCCAPGWRCGAARRCAASTGRSPRSRRPGWRNGGCWSPRSTSPWNWTSAATRSWSVTCSRWCGHTRCARGSVACSCWRCSGPGGGPRRWRCTGTGGGSLSRRWAWSPGRSCAPCTRRCCGTSQQGTWVSQRGTWVSRPGTRTRRPVRGAAQLPPDVRGFTGRHAELAALDELAGAPGTAANGAGGRPLPIGIIAGVAGVGKTGLALHWSHRARCRFPDGQLYADLRGYDADQEPLPPAAVLDGFLRALGVPGDQVPGGLDERAALFRSVLHGRQVLVVLDNARAPEQVRPLLPGAGTCLVLISSRDRLDDLVAREGARLYALDVLSQIEASDLVSRMAGEHRIEPATADRIAALCDRLPLAVRIAAARLAIQPHHAPADLADRLADEQRRLAELSQAHRGVRASFALSYRELPARAAALFRLLGLLDAADAAAWAAAALLGGSEQEAEDLLEQLVGAGLLEVAGRDCAGQVRYRLHDLMRLYARERGLAARSCAERDAAAGRFFGTALHLAERADRCLGNPFVFPLYAAAPRPEPGETVVRRVLAGPVAWLAAECTLLAGAVAQATRLGMAGYAWELTSALGQFLSTHRYTDAWQDCATRAVAAARAAGDVRGEAAALLQYADWLGDVGRYGDAIRSIRRALALVTRCGDTEAEAVCRILMAIMRLLHGQVARADQEGQRALALLGRSAPPAARARALIMLGLIRLYQGRHADSAACFTRVLRIQLAAGSVRGQAEARYRLGTVRLSQGRHAAAVRLLTQAMNSARQSGDLMNAMTAQIRLAQAFLEMGRLDDARPLLDHAVRHVTPEAAPRFRAIALEALGQLLEARQQPEAAAPLIAEARELRQALAVSAR